MSPATKDIGEGKYLHYLILMYLYSTFFNLLWGSKTNHHGASKGGLNVTAPKKTAAQISVREMKSSQK